MYEQSESVLDAIFEDAFSEDDDFDDYALPMEVDENHTNIASAEDGEIVSERETSGHSSPHGLKVSAMEGKDINDTVGRTTLKGGRKRRKKKKKQKNPAKLDLRKFVHDTCNFLREKKVHMIWLAIRALGIEVFQGLLKEVKAIEKCGGQMTADGSRRRLPGGVLWNILKGRVAPETYKDIMKKATEFEKQKSKGAIKRQRECYDDRSSKRQKMDICQEITITPGNREDNITSDSVRSVKEEKILSLDSAILDPKHVQKAWAEGVRGKSKATVVADKPEVSIPVLNRIRVPVAYDDLEENPDDISTPS